MSSIFDPCPDCATCQACGFGWCRAETVSPGEDESICVECFETEDVVA